MARRSMVTLDVDDRTSAMSDQALVCRSRGHKLGEKGMTRRRYQELIKDGMWEDNLYCENGCGFTKTVTWALRSGEVIGVRTDYPKDGSYLLPRESSGRLRRDSARVARVARLVNNYV